MVELTPWVVVAGLAGAALVFFFRARSFEALIEQARGVSEALEVELKGVRDALSKSQQTQKHASSEVQQLRKKLEKAKKRSAPSKAAPATSATRMQELEVALEQARQEREIAREEASGIGAELSRLRAARRAEAEKPEPGEEALRQAQAQIADQGSELERLRTALAQGARDLERMRAKAKTQDLLYTSLRSELDAKKDRLRTQQEEVERLRAMRVALLDAPPSGTGAAMSEPMPAEAPVKDPAQEG